MTLKDKETIQRMLGKIEGVAFVLDDKFATPLLDAIEVIDVILDRDSTEAQISQLESENEAMVRQEQINAALTAIGGGRTNR